MAGGPGVVKKADVIAIDSNVFIIDLRYRDDKNFDANRAFLDTIQANGRGVTSLINLLEITGILSFNLNERQLAEFYRYFPQRYNVSVIPALSAVSHLPEIGVGRLMEIMAKRSSLGDALVLASLETYIPQASFFITWDMEHFKGKSNMEVLTPAEFLKL